MIHQLVSWLFVKMEAADRGEVTLLTLDELFLS